MQDKEISRSFQKLRVREQTQDNSGIENSASSN